MTGGTCFIWHCGDEPSPFHLRQPETFVNRPIPPPAAIPAQAAILAKFTHGISGFSFATPLRYAGCRTPALAAIIALHSHQQKEQAVCYEFLVVHGVARAGCGPSDRFSFGRNRLFDFMRGVAAKSDARQPTRASAQAARQQAARFAKRVGYFAPAHQSAKPNHSGFVAAA